MLIWLETIQNKKALIISKHVCESSCIKKSQVKAIVQEINMHNTQTKEIKEWLKSTSHRVYLLSSNQLLKPHD